MPKFKEYKMYINGEWVDAENKKTFDDLDIEKGERRPAVDRVPYTFTDEPLYFNFKNTTSSPFREFKNTLNDQQIKEENKDKNFYEITFKNAGGLISPLIIEWTYEDETKEVERIPAEIWRSNENEISKVFVKNKKVINIKLDPYLETADTDLSDNNFPRLVIKTNFDKFKNKN